MNFLLEFCSNLLILIHGQHVHIVHEFFLFCCFFFVLKGQKFFTLVTIIFEFFEFFYPLCFSHSEHFCT